jgi:hypothetical protein
MAQRIDLEARVCYTCRWLSCEQFVNELKYMKLKLIYDRQSVGQSVLVPGAHLEPVTNFSFSSKFPSDSCMFDIL